MTRQATERSTCPTSEICGISNTENKSEHVDKSHNVEMREWLRRSLASVIATLPPIPRRGQSASAHARLEKLPSPCPMLTFIVHDLLMPLALCMLLPRLQ